MVAVLLLGAGAAVAAASPARSTAASTEIRVSFRSGAATLSGILSLPAGGGRHAAVVLLSGSERGGVSFPAHVLHARTLARSGFAVLRYDPPGVGRSTGDHRFETLDDRAREAIAAVDYLRSRPEIARDGVGLWGVSQGGWVTQMAAAASRHVAFVVSVSGSGVSPAEQQVYSVEAPSRAAGLPETDVAKAGLVARLLVDWQLARPVYREHNLAQVRRLGPGPWSAFAGLVYTPGSLTPAQRLRRGIAILRSMRNAPWAGYLHLDTAVLPALEAIPPGRLAAAQAAAQKSLLVQPKRYLVGVRCPVLAIWGADDVVVPARKSAAVYRRFLEAAGNRDVTTVVFAHADHSIGNFEPAYWRTLTRWLERRFGPARETSSPTATVVLGPAANGTTVRLRAGDSLVVRLPGNPTTGYRWVVAQRPAVLALAGSRYAPTLPTALGRGGTYTFRFRTKAGSGRLRLAYLRPWETGKPPLRSFAVTIRAR